MEKRRTTALAVLLGLALLGVRAARGGGGETPPPPIKTDERRATTLAAVFAPVAAKVSLSVVAVETPEGDDLGYAVAIDDGTRFLTSRSILESAGGVVTLRARSGAAAEARVLGRNEAYDVALLELRSGALGVRPLPFGSSRGLAIGEWVVTVGTSPERPIGVGVVSALGRRVEPRAEAAPLDLFGLFSENAGPTRAYASVIQHDAPFDASRYGGAPLVDAEGRLVGINVASAYRGSSYAAPIDDVRGFLADLAAGRPGPGLPEPGFIGVGLAPVAAQGGAPAPGAKIAEIVPGAPADRAGLRKGDELLAIDGEAIRGPERVGQLIRAKRAGERVKIRVRRDGEELELPVVVGERPKGG